MTAPDLDIAFDTRAAAHEALRAIAADQGTSLCCFSADFRAWPFDESAFVRQLEQWALRDAKHPEALRFLAIDWSQVRTRSPRFAAFRRDFAHQVACRQISEVRARGLVEMAAAPTRAVYAHTATWMSGESVQSASRLHALTLRFEEAWEQATPAFPSAILGL